MTVRVATDDLTRRGHALAQHAARLAILCCKPKRAKMNAGLPRCIEGLRYRHDSTTPCETWSMPIVSMVGGGGDNAQPPSDGIIKPGKKNLCCRLVLSGNLFRSAMGFTANPPVCVTAGHADSEYLAHHVGDVERR